MKVKVMFILSIVNILLKGLENRGLRTRHLHGVTKLHLADSTITLYSIRAFPSKFKKYLWLNMAFMILYFAVY